jgi:hypothetical protein
LFKTLTKMQQKELGFMLDSPESLRSLTRALARAPLTSNVGCVISPVPRSTWLCGFVALCEFLQLRAVAAFDQLLSVIEQPPSLPWLRRATAVMEHTQPSECFTVKMYKVLGEEVPAAPEEAPELCMFDSVVGHTAAAVFAAVAIIIVITINPLFPVVKPHTAQASGSLQLS